MDNIVAESSDVMVNSLNFGLPETAQYVTSRRLVNYFPSGSNVYASNAGNKQIKFLISGDDNSFLDLSSVRVFATLQNTDATREKFLRPLGGLHAFMSRYRCSIAGQQCQDIIEYARHCELFNCFQSKDVRDMDDIESSANPRWDADYHDYANGLDVLLDADSVVTDGAAANSGKTNGAGTVASPLGVVNVTPNGDRNEWGRIDKRYTRHSMTGIPGANGKARFSHKPCCGLVGHGGKYYLPLRLGSLEMEYTIVSDGTLPVIVPQGEGVGGGPGGSDQTDKQGYYFQVGNTSTSWELNNLLIRAELVSLDNTVANNISSHILSGNSLKMYFPMYHTITQTFPKTFGEINMNIVKSASKLSGAFITLYRAPRTGEDFNRFLPDNYVFKRWNYFYNPMINGRINDVGAAPATDNLQGKGFTDNTRQLSWQLQVQSSKYPEFEAQSLAETFYYLRQAIHYMNPEHESLSFSYRQYRENKFIIGMSFEKMHGNEGVSFTGLNTKMGSLLTFKLKYTEPQVADAGDAVEKRRTPENEALEELFVHLTSDAIVELRSDGAVLYD